MIGRRRGIRHPWLTAAAICAAATPALAYVPNTIDWVGVPVVAHWPADAFPIATRVTPDLTTDVSDGSDRTALERAMATWSSAPDSRAAIFLEAEAPVEANVLDGINAIEFSNDPALEGAGFVTLTFLLTEADGSIVEADMLVNDRSFGFTTEAGSDVGLDLETVMLKEIGRMLGLSNSPVGARARDGTVEEESAVMFAIGRGIGESARTLRPDDIAGVAALYPAAGSGRGAIAGRVTRNGQPVFGAHVIAYDPIQDVLIGAVSLPDGSFAIEGLPPGRYLLRAVPLSGQVGPPALGGIFDDDDVDTGFTATFFGETVRVGARQRVGGVSIEVQQ